MDDNLSAYLDSMSENFDKMNFDGEEGLHLARKVNALASKVNMARGNGVNTHVGIGSNATITQLIVDSYGDLNIVVTRETITIAQDLPYILFAKNDRDAGYIQSLKPLLGAGTTCVVTSEAETGDVLFTFTNGANVDVVRVSLLNNSNNYTSFLSAMNQNFFATKYVLMTISDSTKTDQFNKSINFGLLSALGGVASNTLSPNSRKMTWDFQSDRVNILLPEQKITPDFGFAQKIRQTAGFSITWNIFMSQRSNLNNMVK